MKNQHQKIEVLPHRSEYSKRFEEEAAAIKKILGNICMNIHHVGSTAVLGLVAKPIIDMIVVVTDISLVELKNAELIALGYEVKGEFGIPFRRYFQKGLEQRTHNLHIYEQGNPEIDRLLRFRDWLRTHEEDRLEYGCLKQELAQKFPYDIKEYCMGKDTFVANIDAKAGGLPFQTMTRIVFSATDREWEVVRALRQTYFFDKVHLSDPYTWTFIHPEHIHFVLYQGNNIVGYAHVQLWRQQRAALRIIVIDEKYWGLGLGRTLLRFLEKWLKSKDFKSLHIDARADIISFYQKQDYVHMPFDDPDGYESSDEDIPVGKIL